MDYKIYSNKHESWVAEGLSRGELNQFLLDFFTTVQIGQEVEKITNGKSTVYNVVSRKNSENFLYDLSNKEIIGEYLFPLDLIEVEEDDG